MYDSNIVIHEVSRTESIGRYTSNTLNVFCGQSVRFALNRHLKSCREKLSSLQGKMENNFPNLIAQAKCNISIHLKTPENSKSPRFLDCFAPFKILKPAFCLSKYYGKSSNSSFSMGRKFGGPRTSLGCVFNRYRDDGHRFIAARWEISQCEVIAAFIVAALIKCCAYGNQLVCSDGHGVLCKISVLENNPTWNVGRGALCKISVLQKISRYGVMAAAPDKQRTMAEGVEIVTHHSIHWQGSGKSIYTWNLGRPCGFFNAAVERPTVCGNLTGFKISIRMPVNYPPNLRK
ncbi:hypothetical protein T12_7019 [Trichinella patagoniensis]|uniref:Uncharacterized protein n=1 Tax=Trichinella patagoniensis TaxID=990121 RepID=A0A0V0ZX44_9BILA|nr:hypothetical protein T12_7019 [Trichinella patagoniensis]